nr:colicin-like bacteriocin tRNase domain-containing protein [Klebsiella pneumoniae]
MSGSILRLSQVGNECPCGGCETDKTSGVFSVSIPGLPSLQVSVPKGVPTAKAPPKALLLKKVIHVRLVLQPVVTP